MNELPTASTADHVERSAARSEEIERADAPLRSPNSALAHEGAERDVDS
jgi:hypothetical protein